MVFIVQKTKKRMSILRPLSRNKIKLSPLKNKKGQWKLSVLDQVKTIIPLEIVLYIWNMGNNFFLRA